MAKVLSLLLCMTLMVVYYFFGYSYGYDRGTADVQNMAIHSGVGRWHVNPVTGEKTFEFVK